MWPLLTSIMKCRSSFLVYTLPLAIGDDQISILALRIKTFKSVAGVERHSLLIKNCAPAYSERKVGDLQYV